MLGIALGAAAKSGVDTYEKMLEAKRIQQENEARQRELDAQAAFKKAFEEQNAAQYQGGTDTAELVGQALKFDQDQIKQLQGDFAKMTPGQQQQALQGYARAGYANDGYQETLEDIGVYKDPKTGEVLATSTYEKIDPSKRALNVYDEMVKSGNIYGMQQAGDLYRNSREMERMQVFDSTMKEFRDDQVRLRTVLNDEGLAGVPNGMKDVLKDYGMKAEFVKGKGGHGSLKITMPDGTPRTFNTGKELEQALSRAGMDVMVERMMPLAADAAEAMSFVIDQFNMKMDERTANQRDKQIGLQAKGLDLRERQFAWEKSVKDQERHQKELENQRQQYLDLKEMRDQEKYRNDTTLINMWNAGEDRVDADGNQYKLLPNGDEIMFTGNAIVDAKDLPELYYSTNPKDTGLYVRSEKGYVNAATGEPIKDPGTLESVGTPQDGPVNLQEVVLKAAIEEEFKKGTLWNESIFDMLDNVNAILVANGVEPIRIMQGEVTIGDTTAVPGSSNAPKERKGGVGSQYGNRSSYPSSSGQSQSNSPGYIRDDITPDELIQFMMQQQQAREQAVRDRAKSLAEDGQMTEKYPQHF